MPEKDTLGQPGPPTQAAEAIADGVALASGEDASSPAVMVTFTRAQAEALYDAARAILDTWGWQGDAVKRWEGSDDSRLRLLGATGVLRVALEGV